LILCLVALAVGTPAVAAPSAGTGPEGGEPAPAGYRFAPDDVVEITVSSHMGYDRILTISPDGRFQFPLVGEIVAAGMTASQLAMRIQEGLSTELVDPQVTVSLKQRGSRTRGTVSLLGAVRSPGVFELKEKSTLLELLAAAGGALTSADLLHVTITHADRSPVQTIDLARAVRTGTIDGETPLASGDLIFVPTAASSTVLVTGEVAKPGSYEIGTNTRAMDLLSQAGGANPRADLSRVRLTRTGQVQILNLQAVVSGAERADSTANPVLLTGDTLVLPESENRVYLLGQVAKPDAYPLREGDHLFDLLTRAGGTSPGADPGKAVLIRRNEHGQPEAQPLNLTRMLTKGDMRSNLALRPGDVILIPEKKANKPSALGAFAPLIYPLLGLVNLFRF
jgi:protein involved in polysaccharide export with SLBB domain